MDSVRGRAGYSSHRPPTGDHKSPTGDSRPGQGRQPHPPSTGTISHFQLETPRQQSVGFIKGDLTSIYCVSTSATMNYVPHALPGVYRSLSIMPQLRRFRHGFIGTGKISVQTRRFRSHLKVCDNGAKASTSRVHHPSQERATSPYRELGRTVMGILAAVNTTNAESEIASRPGCRECRRASFWILV